MNILFLGGILDDSAHYELKIGCVEPFGMPANSHQMAFIDGLHKCGCKITLCNSPFIGMFPSKHKAWRVLSRKWKYNNTIEAYDIGYLNIFLFKQLGRLIGCKRLIKKWIEENKTEKSIILCYGNYLPYVAALCYAKKINPKIQNSIILMDMPTQPSQRKSRDFMYYAAKFSGWLSLRYLKYVDGFILLAKDMKDLFKVGKRPYVIIEGILDSNIVAKHEQSNKEKTIVYTGGVHEKYGIAKLVKAFMMVNAPEWRFIVCGLGDYASNLELAQKQDPRINYMGKVAHEASLKFQQSAGILVNPRPDEGDYTKYSFPSKTIEYLAAGSPVVCYKLAGIPDDYDSYLQYIAGDSLEALKDKLEALINLSDENRKLIGSKGRDFVIREKNSFSQCKKIMGMYEELFSAKT